MIFCINHFSLIIFYLSVWLGFKLFESLKFRCIIIWYTYARTQRIWQSPLVIINPPKPPNRKWEWSMNYVMLGGDGPEKLRILKRGSWDWTIEVRVGYSAGGVGFWPLKDVVGFFGSLPTDILNTTCYTARLGGVRYCG